MRGIKLLSLLTVVFAIQMSFGSTEASAQVTDDCFPPFFYISEMDTSLFVVWQDAPTATYLLYYCQTGDTNTVCLTVTGTQYEFVGLPSNTSFSFWMAKICNGDTSDLSAVHNYTTPCGTFTAPYTETFTTDANWSRFAGLLQQASKACREVCPQAKVIIHTERAGQAGVVTDIYRRLADVDYDVIGLSYYPFWHGSLATLGGTLRQLATAFPDKQVQIVETAYYYQWQPSTGITDFSKTWAVSPDGQAAYLKSLIAELKQHDNVNGLYWWFPEENGNGPGSKALTNWVNRGLWDNSSHRALPGLYVLKEFLNRPGTGILMMRDDRRDDQHWYNLQGMRLDSRPQRHGLFINNGKKYVVR